MHKNAVPALAFPQLTVDVGFGEPIVFSSNPDVQTFVARENAFLNKVRASNTAPTQGLDQPIARMGQFASRIHSTIARFEQQNDERLRKQCEEEIASYAQQLRAILTEAYRGRRLILSTSAEGVFLASLPSGGDAGESAYALLHLLNHPFEVNNAAARNGMFKAMLFQSGITPAAATAQVEVLRSLGAKHDAELAKRAADFDVKLVQISGAHEQLNTAISLEHTRREQRDADAAQFLERQSKVFDEQLASEELRLETLRSTYAEHMKLKAPVEYWREKKKYHLSGRDKLARATILVSAFGFLALGEYVWLNFHTLKSGEGIPWREIAGFFVLSSVVFWIVRIFVRLLLSAIHLAQDASEREVMAMTYMALIRGDDSSAKYLDEKDRALVLAPLFRPSATGIINDDAAPAQLSEILTKIAQR